MPGFDLITQRMTVAKFLDDVQAPTYPGLDSFIRTELQDTEDLGSIPFFRKGFELSAADLEIIPGERSEISKISTMALDRDREVLLPEGADLRFFRTNPVVPYAHDYHGLPIGVSKWVKIDNKATPTTLIAKTKYASKEANPFAEQVYLLIIEGILRAKSVGFIPLKWNRPGDDDWVEAVNSWRSRREVMLGKKTQEADPERIYTKWVLLEYSPVPIPSNPEALQLAMKKGILTLDQARSGGFIQGDDIEIDIESISLEGAQKSAEQELETQEGGHLFSEEELRRIADEFLSQDDTGQIEDFFGQKSNHEDFDRAVRGDGMWNKTLPKSFDIAQYDEANTVFRYSLFTKFLDCQVKHIYVNSYDIPSPLIGTYLEAISVVTAGLIIDDTRRFSYEGKESPPSRDYIQLNSRDRKRFLVDGSEYCHENDMPLIKDFSPGWRGLQFSIVTSMTNEAKSDEIMNAIHLEADNNHMLRGEKFALSGEFLSSTDDAWDGLVLNNKDKQAITKSMEITSKADGNSRGLLFVGPPGTGKTKTGRTIMNDTKHTFIWLSTRDFTYGWPETILRLAFNMARKLAPTVLFMEDVDSYLDTDLLKTELDGLKQNKGIMTILTTNHPEKLPKALLDRPGRFHHVILFDLPDEGQRRQMFKLWAGEIEKAILDKLIDATDGFSGAHINHLIEYSKIISEDEDISIDRALVESMLRLSAQMELVAGLQRKKPQSVDAEGKPVAAKLAPDEISDEQVQEILSMVSDQLIQKTEDEDDEPTVEEMIQFASGDFV